MNLIHIYIITVAASFIMHAKAKLEIYKDISDLGYKFNHQKLQQLNEENESELDIITNIIKKYSIYIPVINLIASAIRENNYYKNKDYQIKQLIEYGVLEEMTVKEKEAYNKRKTGFNAIKIEKLRMIKLANASVADFTNGSKIWFDFKEDIEEKDSFTDIIEIIQVEGTYKNLNEEELKKLVYYSLILTGDQMLNTIKEEYNNESQEISKTRQQNKVIEEIIEIEIPLEESTKAKNKIKIKKP